MRAEAVGEYFTRSDGSYLFARWGRPIVPIVFGVEEQTLQTIKGACEAMVSLAGHQMDETDGELGANLMWFFCRDWDELIGVPNLEKLVDGLPALVMRLKKADANQYRVFRFDDENAIRAAFVFIRMDEHLSKVPADALALNQMVQVILLWSDMAFTDHSPLLRDPQNGATILKPEIAAIVRAGYDLSMPNYAKDVAHGLRLGARVDLLLEGQLQ
ncbi:MAG: hypothetical protein AAF198_01495 [Pseudomonadota bacterium]